MPVINSAVFLNLTAAVILLFLMAGQPSSPVRFQDVAGDAGINFTLQNSPTSDKQMIETMAGGLAIFDADGGGRPDLFFTNGADLPSLRKNDPKYWNRLYRNEGHMKFRDVTSEAGVAGDGYSIGASVADYDNDGRPDLLVAGVNRNIVGGFNRCGLRYNNVQTLATSS